MEQSNSHIILDMDGVLVNFIGGVEKVLNVDLSELDQWDIPNFIGMSPKDFWKAIEQEKRFWAELEPYPWTRDLINLCLEFSGGNVTIATSPSQDPNCAGQKMWWICSRYPQLKRAFLIGPQKHLLAKPNHILIDDFSTNCHKFIENGGQAIVFPQLWNGGDVAMEEGETRLDYVERMLNNFVQ